VRYIRFADIAETVESLCVAACYELPEDVLAALMAAAKTESNQRAANVLNVLVENARLAREQKIPLCQDTGLAVVFVEQGCEVAVASDNGGTPMAIGEAVNAGIRAGYEKGYLRRSVVAEPLKERKNTGTNTPAIMHHFVVPGDRLRISVMAKGGGCENRSQFRMFRPTAERTEIIEWVVEVVRSAGADACPPFVVGVGLGGDFELSCLLSKKALLRRLDEPRRPSGMGIGVDRYYAELEAEMLSRINGLGLGPQGLGGDTTALAVLIETAGCHIASLPAAVNIECHSHRHKSAVL
jgi:fumarate hydratase subunit alpha